MNLISKQISIEDPISHQLTICINFSIIWISFFFKRITCAGHLWLHNHKYLILPYFIQAAGGEGEENKQDKNLKLFQRCLRQTQTNIPFNLFSANFDLTTTLIIDRTLMKVTKNVDGKCFWIFMFLASIAKSFLSALLIS